MSAIDELISNSAKASASAFGNRIRDGKYLLLLKKFFVEKKFKGTFAIAEFTVVSSEAYTDLLDKDDKPETVIPNAVGSDCSTAIDLTDTNGPSNLRALIDGFAGQALPEAEYTALVNDLRNLDPKLGKVQPGRGYLLGCHTGRRKIKTGKNAGNIFVACNWKHVADAAGNDDASVAKRCAELDAKGA